MNRREFCAGAASLGLTALGPAARAGQSAASQPAFERDPDPAGGYTPDPPRQFLFTDYRHIDPGDLGWVSPDGKGLPVADPPPPPVRAIATAQGVAQGIRLVAQKPIKQGPISGLAGRVTYEDGRYRAWSMAVSYGEGKHLGSYSVAPAVSIALSAGESKDGFAWEWKKGNEIKPPPVTGIDGDHFFIDPHGPPEERYKCIYNARVLTGVDDLWRRYQQIHPRHRDVRINGERVYCLFGMVSADGLNWKQVPEPLMIHMGDTDNTVYYDAWLGKYVLYTRLYWMQRRLIARAESDDFHQWTPVNPIVWPRLEDPLSWDVYTNGRTNYPGLPEHHLLFPVFYRRLTQDSEVHLHSSIDGIHWQRVPGGPVLVSGPPGSWDQGWLVAGKGMIPLEGDRVAIPYSATDHPHKYPRWPGVIKGNGGFCVWPRGRLVALTAEAAGSFRTFPIQVTGQQLKLNAHVARAGEIRVGLSGVKGRSTADCDPVIGDHAACVVTWKKDPQLSLQPGEHVTLSFQMRSAELFGFEWV
jgi:hypothetical protein